MFLVVKLNADFAAGPGGGQTSSPQLELFSLTSHWIEEVLGWCVIFNPNSQQTSLYLCLQDAHG